MRRLPLVLLCVSGIALAQPAPPDAPVGEPAPEPAPPQPPAGPPPAPQPPAPVAEPSPLPSSAVSSAALAPEPAAADEPTSVHLEGFLQPQLRFRQDSAAQFDENGLRFARARAIVHGKTRLGDLVLSAFLEAELQPTFDMVDAFVTATCPLPGKGEVSIDVGQMRVPVSRQQLLSDSRLAFVDKAAIATIAPRRDLGVRLGFVVPKVPQVHVVAGMFNGEGPNQVQNINQKFLYAGRVEITPLGREAKLAESAFGGNFVTAAVSVGLNKLTAGTRREDVRYLGFDISAAWKGLSGSFEYLDVDHAFTETGAMTVEDYRANGFVAQANYLLPIELPPARRARLEVGARFEEIDRNDNVPISQLGDPEQSVRQITGVVSLYLRNHSLKAQLAVSHFEEIETLTSVDENAVYDNDQVLLQVTYRLE